MAPIPTIFTAVGPHIHEKAKYFSIRTCPPACAPNRIFNIEWRTVLYQYATAPQNFEVRLYENDPSQRFDVIIGTLTPPGYNQRAWVSGVQGDSNLGFCSEDFCICPPALPPQNVSRTYTLTPCLTPTPTATPSVTPTATPTLTPTATPTPTPRHTPTPRPRPTPLPRPTAAMNIRHLEEVDYDPIIAVIDNWWDGRQISQLLPRIFFVHFRPTSFAIEEGSRVIGFLAGFVSQTDRRQAYIYFVAIDPNHRKRGLGHQLYSTFFETVHQLGCTMVRCITSPMNTGSVAFHTQMGFHVEHVNGEYNGIPCTINYELNGADRVLFAKNLS